MFSMVKESHRLIGFEPPPLPKHDFSALDALQRDLIDTPDSDPLIIDMNLTRGKLLHLTQPICPKETATVTMDMLPGANVTYISIAINNEVLSLDRNTAAFSYDRKAHERLRCVRDALQQNNIQPLLGLLMEMENAFDATGGSTLPAPMQSLLRNGNFRSHMRKVLAVLMDKGVYKLPTAAPATSPHTSSPPSRGHR